MANEDVPAWARRLVLERTVRGWTQQQAIDAMRLHAPDPLPEDRSLLRMWKNWEAGRHRPSREHRRAIAAAFGTVSDALFGPDERLKAALTGAAPGVDDIETLELVARLRRSDVDAATLDTLTVTIERLCSEYAHAPAADLRSQGQAWMSRLVSLLDSRLTLTQHREVLILAGWLALLIGCVEYDLSDTGRAEQTRRAAWHLGREADHAPITAWAQELRSWFALTQGRYREVVEAARAGSELAPRSPVAVQLAAQEAKAWARAGDRRHVELALERGRVLLESLPYPDNIENHFAVDPDKFDFYAMDCYRRVGDNGLAAMHADEVIRKSTAPDGSQRSPMRITEAQITHSVVAARDGDLDRAIELGHAALDIPRQSRPSLVMVSQDLADELRSRFPGEAATSKYLAHLRALSE